MAEVMQSDGPDDAVDAVDAEIVEQAEAVAEAQEASPSELPVVEAEVLDEPLPEPAAPADPPPPPSAHSAEERPKVVYVQTPLPPKKAGNRGAGVLIALGGAVVYGLLLAGAEWIFRTATGEADPLSFLGYAQFYAAVGVFAVAFIVVALLVNRGPWWVHIVASIFVGLAVYFGTSGVRVLYDWFVGQVSTPFTADLVSPVLIIAAILAREAALWFGAIISARGRHVTARNRRAREAFDTELAEYRASLG